MRVGVKCYAFQRIVTDYSDKYYKQHRSLLTTTTYFTREDSIFFNLSRCHSVIWFSSIQTNKQTIQTQFEPHALVHVYKFWVHM